MFNVTYDGVEGEKGEKGASSETPCESRVSRQASIRIIGLGNEFRGDDAVGLLAARQLQRVIGDRAEVIEAEMAGVELLELMKGVQVVLLLDAVSSGKTPGVIHRFDASAGPIAPELFPQSTHAVGVADALELARTLGVLPHKAIVYGVEVSDTGMGHPLSPHVDRALNEVVGRVLKEIDHLICTNFI